MPKKILFFVCFLFLIVFSSCVQNAENQLDKRVADSIAITQVVTGFYKWSYQQHNDVGSFKLLDKDSIYIGIDFDSVKKNIERFENNGFFDNEFIAGYKQLADKIDAVYKNEPFRIDDGIPPYGPFDYDVYFNSQDMPENPVENFFYDSLKIENNKAEIWWGWKDWDDGKPRYYVKLRFDNNQWKITNLMGFDQELKITYIQ